MLTKKEIFLLFQSIHSFNMNFDRSATPDGYKTWVVGEVPDVEFLLPNDYTVLGFIGRGIPISHIVYYILCD
jgi:hypothetical protein